ncbi:MAG TPA: chemotaxis protein CheW, partial [Candidatus Sulfotelmatobacter sp.]|nr:chemotaxis protein CheW [Candidatus Sulfotelmatobacter sp.]
DLAVRFGLAERPFTKTTCIVVVEVKQDSETTVMGIVADAVNQVIDLASEEIEQPPAFGTQIRLDYLAGMGKLGKKFALILNIDSVLSATELLAVSAVHSAASEPRKETEAVPQGAARAR